MAILLGFRTAVVTGVVALAIVPPLLAERLPVRIFTTADGLPRDQLQCVRSDRRGFIWFCTAEGLVRFDGQVAVSLCIRYRPCADCNAIHGTVPLDFVINDNGAELLAITTGGVTGNTESRVYRKQFPRTED